MLTDVQVRKAKAGEKAIKLTDGGGPHLCVTPAGARLWRLRYEFGGKEKLLSLGAYPDVSLSDARVAREKAKRALRSGQDPSVLKRQARTTALQQAGQTFELVAREWYALQKLLWSTTQRGHAASPSSGKNDEETTPCPETS